MRSRKKITLVELLIVIAVIIILAGMLLPVPGKTKAKAMSVDCTGNLKPLGHPACRNECFSLDFPVGKNFFREFSRSKTMERQKNFRFFILGIDIRKIFCYNYYRFRSGTVKSWLNSVV